MRRIQDNIITLLRKGGVGVLPTDTIYGIVGSALRPKTVARIYKLRKRNPKKPMIILIGSIKDLGHFGVRPDVKTGQLLKAIWFYQKQHTNILENVGMLFYDGRYGAGKIRGTSVVLPIKTLLAIRKFKYLHRGTKTLAFRLPRPLSLRALLQKTGPLVAPSANWEGMPPAYTIREAKKYFGGRIDFYVDEGALRSKSSTLVKIRDGNISVLRNGSVKT